jgi:MerR family transcriptional regulator, redox-sensitive transcriptional activator SoxR
MEELTIGEVARRTGVRTSALRFYEQAGVLPAPRRVNGRRRYPPDVVRVVEVLRFAQQAGFALDEVRTLFHGFGAEVPLAERWEALAQAKLQELDTIIARATQMKRAIEAGLACGCVRVEDCVLPEHGCPGAAPPGARPVLWFRGGRKEAGPELARGADPPSLL